MATRPYFPKIYCRETSQGHEAVVAVKLESILSGRLVNGSASGRWDDAEGRANALSMQNAHEALLKSIVSWPSTVTLAFSMTVMPDITIRSESVFLITLFIAVRDVNRDRAHEQVLSRYMALMPVLESHIPWCVFAPVTSERDFMRRYRPFTATHATAIGRRQENVLLSEDIDTKSTGFSTPFSADAKWASVIRYTYPWMPSGDSWMRLLDTFSCQLDPVQMLVRIQPQHFEGMPATIAEHIQTCEKLLATGRPNNVTFTSRIDQILRACNSRAAEFSGAGFRVGTFLLAPHPIDSMLSSVVAQALVGDSGGDISDGRIFKGGFNCKDADAAQAHSWDYFDSDEPYSVAEAACAFRLPFPPFEDLPGLPIRHSRTRLANIQGFRKAGRKALTLFRNLHGRTVQDIRIQSDQRMRHCFIVGQTGTGKSKLMKSWIRQDIERGDGVALIDPHGELVEEILELIPERRIKDVVLLDVLQERPVGFNLLEYRTIQERDLIIDELYRAMGQRWDMKAVGGPMFEMHYRGMMQLLMGTRQDLRSGFMPTVLEFMHCYQNDDFREWLCTTTDDEQVRVFIKEAEETGGEAKLKNMAPYVTSKFSVFYSDTTIRRIVGQEKTTFSFEDIMNNRKIFLVNLAKGRLGSDVAAMLTNQLVSRFKLAAMKRAEVAPDQRPDFYLYVDEAHNLPADNFIEMLAESRKYRMGLVLATQYTGQLRRATNDSGNLLSSILGNVGTTVMFRVGSEDAALLEPVLAPHFSKSDLIGLPNFEGYAYMSTNNEAPQAFSFRTVLPPAGYGPERAQQVREISSQRYGRDAEEVDMKIKKRRQFVESGGKQNPFEKYGPK
jgi:hypothetical protein